MISKFPNIGLILFFLFCLNVQAQEKIESLNIKREINQLNINQDIIGANDLINSNNSIDPKYALNVLTENLKTAKTLNKTYEIAHTYKTLGNFWLLQSNKIKAYENYLQAKTYSAEHQDLTGMVLLNLAIVTDDLEVKIEYYNQAIQIFKEINDIENLSKAYLNLGNTYVSRFWQTTVDDSIYSKQNILAYYKKQAISALDKVENINKESDAEIIATAYVYYGQLYKYEKDYDKSEFYFLKAKELSSDQQNIKILTYCNMHLADLALRKKEYSKALELLKSAEEFSKKYNYNEYINGVYELYINLYTQQNDYEKAFEFSQKHDASNNKLNEMISKDKIHALNLEYSLAENELKIEKYEAQSKFNRILLIVLIFIAVLIAGISYLIIKNKKRKIDNIEKSKKITELEKSAIEIKLKNQLLEEQLLKEKIMFSQNHLVNFAGLSHKIQFFLEELKTKVKKLPNGQQTQEDVNLLKTKFSEILNNQNDFKQIDSMSNQLNQDFFFHIQKQYPSISKEDEKLLSFIILNMSTKEMSSNLNISSSSVYKKRYRLRKKLKLENEETFQDFYQKIISSLN